MPWGLKGTVYTELAPSCYHLQSTPCTQLAGLSPLRGVSVKTNALAPNEPSKGLV